MFIYNAYIHGYTNAHFNIQKCPKYIKIEGGFSFPPKGVFWPTVGCVAQGGSELVVKMFEAATAAPVFEHSSYQTTSRQCFIQR